MMGVLKSWFKASLQGASFEKQTCQCLMSRHAFESPNNASTDFHLLDPAYFNVILSHYAACVTLRTKAGYLVESLMLRMESSRICQRAAAKRRAEH
jgi:hypothetical protein